MIYRVIVRTTSSLQPVGTFWQEEVLYCGTDKEDALVALYGSEPEDFGAGYGNHSRRTEMETINPEEVSE